MSEILNDIIYWCGVMFIFLIGCVIIGWIILKIKEITYDAHQNLIELRNIKRKYREALKFAEWVAEEIFSDDWEYNKDSFGEIACRKLEKVGIVKLIDGHWVLAESEDKE